MNDGQMRDHYAAWEKAKRDSRALDADVAKAKKRLDDRLDDDKAARQALEHANKAADQSRQLTGRAKPTQEAAIAKAEVDLEAANKGATAARAALHDLQRRQVDAKQVTGEALTQAQRARCAYTESRIEAIQRTLRSDRALQATLAQLYVALQSGTDPAIGVAVHMTWDELMIETFPQPRELPKAA